MYKIDRKTLKQITEILDDLSGTNPLTIGFVKAQIKARKLSQKIKDEYTHIKK